ncbi:MAG: HDIG domain-containing metalloprotein [Pyrinomonadaceae bacterium]
MSTRRPKFTSRADRAREAVQSVFVRPFKWFSPNTRALIGFSVLVLVTALLLASNYQRRLTTTYREGDVVHGSVIAPADITNIDPAETGKKRSAAMDATRPVFNYDPARSEESAQNFRLAWENLQKQAGSASARKALVWSGEGGEAVARAFIPHLFKAGELERIMRPLRETGDEYIYDDRDIERLKEEIVLVDPRNSNAQMIIAMPQTRMTSMSAARQNLRTRITQLSGWAVDEREALATALLPLVKPNVIFNQTASEMARETEASKIAPVTFTLRRNQIVAREGDKVTPSMLAQFAAIDAHSSAARPWYRLLGLLFIVAALYWAAWEFIEHRSTTISLPLSKRRAFALVGLSVVVQTLLMRVGFGLTDNLAMPAPFDDPTLLNFAIPFAAAALLVALLVDTQLALITALITALFAGMLGPTGVLTTFYAIVASSAAIYGIGRYRERQSVTLAGLIVGGINAVMALALLAYGQQSLTPGAVLVAIGCGIMGGLLTTVFVAGGLPINETLFGILTDVKLLELSNADLPVLGQLALRAPGTNQHSHAVGQLAEDACRAIGANPLLARIGALYHDIGKLAAPDYFVENQQGNNPHDRLRPTQSARIITSHVTYGLKLAKQIGLPNRISDFIPQHHGTRTLHFFLRKAQAHAAPHEEIDEAEFRYPGPKPQFKEAAIMMIADSCEAAARSLARPDPENIRTIVNKIVDAIVSDGQLDECDITMRELTTIREAVIMALTAIYHARIDYPGFNPPSLTNLPTLPDAQLDTEERGITYNKPSEIPINKGGEVEDEALTREK